MKGENPDIVSEDKEKLAEMDVYMFAVFPWLFLVVYLLFLYLDV